MSSLYPGKCCDCFSGSKPLRKLIDPSLVESFLPGCFFCEECLLSREVDLRTGKKARAMGIPPDEDGTKWSPAGKVILKAKRGPGDNIEIDVMVRVPVSLSDAESFQRCGHVRSRPSTWSFWVATDCMDFSIPGFLSRAHLYAVSSAKVPFASIQFQDYEVCDTVLY